MKQLERWRKAQLHEKAWWSSRTGDLDLDFYKGFAEELLKELEGFLDIRADTYILEIGSGAAGTLTFLKESKHRYAIDPLEDFFSSIEAFTRIRDEAVHYRVGQGESLPFGDAEFDLVIMDNVLDHCSDPCRVLEETARVLKSGGVFYFRQNTYHIWGKIIRGLLEHLEIDMGHPHTFTKTELEERFKKLGIDTLKRNRMGYLRTWVREITSGKSIDLVKALMFTTRDRTLYVLKKS